MNPTVILSFLVAMVMGTEASLAQPDIYGLINVLYLKADGNLDGHITQGELAEVFKGFDKNGDGTVTSAEFISLWMALTSQTHALANAYFHLADVNDDKVIDTNDYPIIYALFDENHDGSVSSAEFAAKWEDIIRESPFAVLFERSDHNNDEMLTHGEFKGYFSSFDANSDGSVDSHEFDDGWSHADFVLNADAKIVFTDIDSNRDGLITEHPDMDALFTKYDANADNHIQLQEIIQMKALLVIQSP